MIYSTADGQIVDQAIPLKPTEDGLPASGQLPPGNLGLQQDYEYYLSAGDCQTRPYRIEVRIAPTIDIDQVTYHYPPYTDLTDQTVKRPGDLQAIEGTEVTLYAKANTEIKPGTAEIDLGCTGRHGVSMTSDGRTADGPFHLADEQRRSCPGPRTIATSFVSRTFKAARTALRSAIRSK